MEAVLRRTAILTLSQKTALLCGLYILIAAAAFPATFTAVLGSYPILRYYIVIPPLFLAGMLAAALLHAPRSPVQFMRDKLADRGLGALAIFSVFLLSATAFTSLKHEYALMVPFFADTALADLDKDLHFGDPWRYARAIVPDQLDPLLFTLYSQVWFVQVVAVFLYACFISNRAQRERYLLSFALSVILLSSVVRLAGSSSGPVFYDRVFGGERFADLIVALKMSPAGPRMLEITDYLYQSHTSASTVLGTGIAAMPSLHVALAFINALFLASRSRAGGYVAWTYFAIIMFGSVYFGWHYALDGYVSIIVVLAIWRLTRPHSSLWPHSSSQSSSSS